MFPEERRLKISGFAKASGSVTTLEVARKFRVSIPTVRRDLALLESEGHLKRTHGGAIAANNSIDILSFHKRLERFSREKERIADYAVSLIKEGDTVILDTGTTTYKMARLIKARGLKDFTVITNSLEVVIELTPYKEVRCILLGGELRHKTLAFTGQLAIDNLKGFHADKLFLATSGIHLKKGFTELDEEEAWVKKKFLETAREKIAVADSSKIGKTAFARVCGVSALDMIITDAGIAPATKKGLKQKGVKVVVV